MKHFKKIAIPVLLGTCLTASAASVAYANTEKKVGGYTSENVIAQIDDSAVTITDLEGNEAFLAAGPHGGAGAKSVFTDGVVSSTQTAMLVDSDGNGVIGYVTVDAGSVYTVNKVFVDIVHDWGATDFRIELSETADFADYNVVYSNVDGYSYSADSDVAISTVLGNVPNVGLTFEFSPVKARYIRVTGNTFGNGSNQNYTCLGEIGMYGITEGYVVSANRIGGKVSAEEGVVLSATDGAEIYYTVDGSVPTVDSAKYSEPIVAEKSLKLRAVAYKDGVYGTPFDYEYTFAAVKPEFVPVNIAKGKTVTVYKTDGSEIGVKNHNGSDTADAAVDGIKGTSNSFQLEGVGWVQVDFGASAWINRVDLTLWHDWVFRSITVQLSDDPTFASGVYTIVCTDNKGWQVNSSFCGSLDPNCPIDVNSEWIPHSGDGWTFNFAPVKGRYLRTLNQAGQGEYTTVLTEIQAYTCEEPEQEAEYEIGANIAKGKTVTVYKTDGSEIGVKSHNGSDTADAAVDGIKGTGNSFQLEGVGWVQVDFGVSAWINRVDLTLWHDWVFRSITVQLSDDPTFASGVYTIVCTDNKGWQVNSSFCGSLDPNCPIDVNGEWIPHSGDGWTFNFAPVKGRYLRTLNQAGQGEYTTVLTEIQAYTCEEPSEDKEVVEFDFSSISDFADLSALSAGIDPNTENEQLGYTDAGWVTYARELNQLFTLDGGLRTNLSAYSGSDVSDNTIYVRLNNKDLQYYKSTMTYTLNAGNGWAGFVVNYTDYSRKGRWGDSPNGIEIFVQKEGKTTYSSSKLNNSGYTEVDAPAGWDTSAAHTIEMTVSENGISIVLDGTETLVLTAEDLSAKGLEIVSAAPTFFVSNTDFTVLSYCVEYDKPSDEYEYRQFVSSVSLPDDKEVFVNRDFADIGLSDTVVITYSDGTSKQVKVDYDSSSYDKTTAGTYEFTLGVSDELDFYGLLSGASVKVVVKAIDYSAIDLAISKAEAAEQTAYTVTSYGAMTEALSAAKTVKSEEYKTQAQVDAAEKALSDKVADLKARGDVTELKALLEEVKTLKSTDYTQSTFAALQEEIASSEEVVAEGGNADLDQAQVDARFAALNAAKNALVAFADTSALEAYYEQCVETYGNEEGDTHGYYITGYVYYLDRMEDAEKVFAKKQSGELAQSEADECLVALKEAVAALERCADMTELKAAVKAAEDADASAYTSSSYAAMKQVYDEVVAISNKDASYMMQEEADEATEKMNGGLALLVSLGDKTELNQAIAQYSGESEEEYISAGFGAYSEAVYNAMAVKSSDDVSQEDVDAAVSALKAAYEALVRKGDKSVLTDLIAAAKEKLASETNETRKENLEKAIAFAEELVNFDGEVTAEQVEQSKEVLESAMKEGKKKGGCSGSVSAAGLAALAVLALAACVVIYRRKINE